MTDKATKLPLPGAAIWGQEGDKKIYRIFEVDELGRLVLSSTTDIDVEIRRDVLAQIEATIPINTSQTGVIEYNGSSGGMIMMPDAWTAADITFIVRQDAGIWKNLYDESGSEVVVVVAADRGIPLPPELFGCDAFRIRSGTLGTPVNQGAARTIFILRKG